ncbi:MAG TPA: hypothetical protein PKH70_09590 [Syntrophorhabdaceae bacterium]|nr:hypothetical protein [Syntrophorhabdaceae bacterium]HNZ59806.1 hypothetical protein [Syntrophorhabdaceae bacterium]HOG40904.1 hypothetical protein [Syntrophorhabdaceae bacterium]
MKNKLTISILVFSFCIFVISTLLIVCNVYAQGEDQKKYEEYRKAIKKEYGIDIIHFRGNLKGGRADGKPITKYDLQQLLMGIKIEQEHTSNRMTALEIATDHLEEIPDYYTRLEKMEKDAEAEMKAKEEQQKK